MSYADVAASEAVRVLLKHVEQYGDAAIYRVDGWESSLESMGARPLILVNELTPKKDSFHRTVSTIVLEVWSTDGRTAFDIANELSQLNASLINHEGWIRWIAVESGAELLPSPSTALEGFAVTLLATYA